ncbi:MAG: radical SAM protein [Candidatus Micrarchaeia archaeon]
MKIIENNSKDVNKYKITFYGGEPLLNIEVLKYFVERFETIDKNKFKFSIITNGSLVDESIAKYFKEHSFSVSLSLDGWENLNKNRMYTNKKESFFNIIKALSILKQNGITPGISCTVTNDNYLFLDEIVDFFYKLGIKAIGFNVVLDATNKEYAVEDPKLLAYYLFRGFTRAIELDIYEDRIGKRRAEPLFKETPRFYDCPAYGQQIAFSPKGTLGPCQAFFTTNLYQEKISTDFSAINNFFNV